MSPAGKPYSIGVLGIPIQSQVVTMATGTLKRVAVRDTLVLIESTKMEIPVMAEAAGVVVAITLEEGGAVNEGQYGCHFGGVIKLSTQGRLTCGTAVDRSVRSDGSIGRP